MAADQEVLSVEVVDAGTGGVVVVTGNVDATNSGMVTLIVVVLQCVAAEVAADATVVVGTLIVLDVGNSGIDAVEVVSSV